MASASNPTPVTDPNIGRVIAGKFEIRARIAQGAMGVVYRAQHVTLEVPLAIKLLHGQLAADEQFSRRFEREAKIACTFVHANSVRVFDCGAEPDGTLYLAMELIQGRDLWTIYEAEGRMAPVRAARIVLQVLSALGAAHAVGVVHRDIKPENVLIVVGEDDNGDPTEIAKVCDFGIASVGGLGPQASRLTTQGLIIGTPAYMSPEQARGEATDARSDLYSLGVVLFQLITGRAPFEAETPLGIVLKHVSDLPPRPESIYPDVHAALAAVAMRAMEKNAADRYQTARAMRAAVRDAMSWGDQDARSMLPPSGPREEGYAATMISQPGALPQVNVDRGTLPGAVSPAPAESKRGETSAPLVVPPASTRTPASRVRPALTLLGAVLLGAALVLVVPRALRGTETASTPPRQPVVGRAASVDERPTPTPHAPDPTPSRELAAEAPPVAPPTVAAPATTPNRGPEHALPVAKATKPEAPLLPTAPVAPPPEPVVAPPVVAVVAPVSPAPPPPTVATPTPSPAAPAPKSPAHARVDFAGTSGERGVTPRNVQAGVASVMGRITECYRAAFTGTPGAGTGTLHLDTDGEGVVTAATAHLPVSPSAARCIERAIVGVQLAGVDTGEATADVSLSFHDE